VNSAHPNTATELRHTDEARIYTDKNSRIIRVNPRFVRVAKLRGLFFRFKAWKFA
jgi:hypothetical protein